MAKKKAENSETRSEQLDLLASDVLSIINKSFKELNGNAIGLLSDANFVNDWVSTGSDILDLAISNKPNGGIPLGFITEIFGQTGSSKSLLGAHIMASCQQKSGVAVLYDTENAVGMLDFYLSIGLDPKRTIYSDKLRALEDIYESIETLIENHTSNVPLVIIVDSVMGATTKSENESDYDIQGWNTRKAIINSGAMRRLPGLIAGRKIAIVLINQVRDNLGAMFGADTTRTSGGQAIPFTASVRLKTKVVSRSTKNLDGETVEVQVIKNRFGPPRKKVEFTINYDSGIDNYSSWFNSLKEFGVLRSAGSYGYSYDFIDPDTAELSTIRFKESDFEQVLDSNPQLRQAMYEQICENYIMKYDIKTELNTE